MRVSAQTTHAAAPTNSLGASLRALVDADLATAFALLGWHGSRVHEGIHKGRKALREARAIVALGGTILGPGAELIDREVQRLSRDLSRWRDGHALVEAVGRLLKRETDPERTVMLRRARQAAAHARAALGRAAGAKESPLPSIRTLLTTLRMALPSLAWHSISPAVINDAVAASRDRLRKAIDRALGNGRAQDWHRVRRRVRRLSQQYAVLERLAVNGIAHRSDFVKEREQQLAKRLGQAQDYELLQAHCGDGSVFADGDDTVLRSLARRQLKRTRRAAARLIGEAAEEGGGSPEL